MRLDLSALRGTTWKMLSTGQLLPTGKTSRILRDADYHYEQMYVSTTTTVRVGVQTITGNPEDLVQFIKKYKLIVDCSSIHQKTHRELDHIETIIAQQEETQEIDIDERAVKYFTAVQLIDLLDSGVTRVKVLIENNWHVVLSVTKNGVRKYYSNRRF